MRKIDNTTPYLLVVILIPAHFCSPPRPTLEEQVTLDKYEIVLSFIGDIENLLWEFGRTRCTNGCRERLLVPVVSIADTVKKETLVIQTTEIFIVFEDPKL